METKTQTKILTPEFESRREKLRMLEIDIEILKKLFPPPGGVFASIAYCGLLDCYCAIAMGHELVCGGKFGVGRLDMTF